MLNVFHHAQRLALKSKTRRALRWLNYLEATILNRSDCFDDSWLNYVRATHAYLMNDIKILCLLESECGANVPVIQRLTSGLKTRNHANYSEDYQCDDLEVFGQTSVPMPQKSSTPSKATARLGCTQRRRIRLP